jgi:hypothetical protein
LQSPLRGPLQKKAGRSGAASKDDTWVAASFILSDVRFTPESGHSQRKSKCPLWAMCGRLRVGKNFLHVAALVGAAMCSAF